MDEVVAQSSQGFRSFFRVSTLIREKDVIRYKSLALFKWLSL